MPRALGSSCCCKLVLSQLIGNTMWLFLCVRVKPLCVNMVNIACTSAVVNMLMGGSNV